MLTKVTLTNFQSHKHLELELDKFTTLTGGSNSGKSAVLRAILALVRNDSAGDYLRYGQKTLSVVLEFSDGVTVEWVKGSGENYYVLTDTDGTPQKFDKVGAGVPEEVSKALGLGPVIVPGLSKQYINFHTQLESPFLISYTPGDVAKLLGELTSASQLYTAVGEGNKAIRSSSGVKSTRTADLRDVLRQLEDFEDLSDQQSAVSYAQELIERATEVDASVEEVTQLSSKHVEKSTNARTLAKSIESLKNITSVDLTALTELDESLLSISELVESIDAANSDIGKKELAVKYLERALSADLSTLNSVNEELESLTSVSSNLEKINQSIVDLEGYIKDQVLSIDSIESQIDSVLDGLDVCPSCGQDLNEETKEELKRGRHRVH